MKFTGISASLLAGCASIALAAPALAQEAEQSGGLAEIVVTAQKRSQNVQDAPLAVTALAGDTLVKSGVSEVRELSRLDPTVQVGQATGVVNTFIRGIGNPVTTAGNEASVPVYIDDVYFVRAAAPFFDLASVDRVEILKGPQGTLFGRNASGGVISIYTKDPNFSKPELEMRLGYGNFETVDAKAYVNMPITDRVAANLSVSYHDQNKGWGKNRQLINPLNPARGYKPGGTDYFLGDSFSARGKILAELTDTTTIKLIGYYEDSKSSIGFYSRPFNGTVGGTPDPVHSGFGPGTPGSLPAPTYLPKLPSFYDVSLPEGKEQYTTSKGHGFSIRIDQETGFADLVSITAMRKNKEIYYANGNYSPYDYAYYDLNILDKQFSQEFQIKSKAGSKVNWIVGAYYLNADGGFKPTKIHGPAIESLGGLDSINLFGKQKVKSYAGFAQATFPLGESTNITAGIRYTKDKVIGQGCTQVLFTPATAAYLTSLIGADAVAAAQACNPDTLPLEPSGGPVHESFSKVTWKGSIDHKFSEDVMAYASISRGYKAGTFNTLPLKDPILKPEVVDAYEIGLKTELFDRKVRLNLAAFWNDIKSPQVQAMKNGLVFLRNAESARTKGVEFDMTIAAAEGLTLRLAGSYLDAKFRKFLNAPSYLTFDQCQAVIAAGATNPNYGSCTTPAAVPGNLNTITLPNVNGNTLPYASKWKFNAAVNYETDIASAGKLAFDLNALYAGKFAWDADNVMKEPSHFMLDGSIAFTPEAFDNLTLRFWMKNITKEKYNINFYAQASGSAYSSAPGAPRTFGGEVLFKF